MSPPELLAGSVVVGKYTIRSLLYHGGVMATYRAVAAKNREVVLKIYDPAITALPDVLKALAQDQSISAKLPSQYVVRMIDRGTDANSGAPFTVTDFETAPSLAQLIERGPLSTSDLTALVRNVAQAVDKLHASGIEGLTLHPANVFVNPGNQYETHIADFAASLVRRALPASEKAVRWMPWLAPEQIKAQAPPTRAADVFALGLLAFFAAAGKIYWRSSQVKTPDVAALRREILAERMPASVRAGEFAIKLSPAVDAVFARVLAFRPADRYATAREFAVALEAALSGRSIAEVDAAQPQSANVPSATAKSSAGGPAAAPASSSGKAAQATPRNAPPPPRTMPQRATMVGMGSPGAGNPSGPSAAVSAARPPMSTMLGIGDIGESEIDASLDALEIGSPFDALETEVTKVMPGKAAGAAMAAAMAPAKPAAPAVTTAKIATPAAATAPAKGSAPKVTAAAKAEPPAMARTAVLASPATPTAAAKPQPPPMPMPAMPVAQAGAAAPATPTAAAKPQPPPMPVVPAMPIVQAGTVAPATPAAAAKPQPPPMPVVPAMPIVQAGTAAPATPAAAAKPQPPPMPMPAMPIVQAGAAAPATPAAAAKPQPPPMPVVPAMPIVLAGTAAPAMPAAAAKPQPPPMPVVPAMPIVQAGTAAPAMPVVQTGAAEPPTAVASDAQRRGPPALPMTAPPAQMADVLAKFEAGPSDPSQGAVFSAPSGARTTDVVQASPAWPAATLGDLGAERVETGVAVIGADFVAETPKSSRWRWIVGVSGLLVLTGSVAFALSGSNGSSSRGRMAPRASETTAALAAAPQGAPHSGDPAGATLPSAAANAVAERPAEPQTAATLEPVAPAPPPPAVQEPEPAAPAPAAPPIAAAEPATPTGDVNSAREPSIAPARRAPDTVSTPAAAPAPHPASPKKNCGKFLKRCK